MWPWTILPDSGPFAGTYVVVSDDSNTVKVWRFTTAGVGDRTVSTISLCPPEFRHW